MIVGGIIALTLGLALLVFVIVNQLKTSDEPDTLHTNFRGIIASILLLGVGMVMLLSPKKTEKYNFLMDIKDEEWQIFVKKDTIIKVDSVTKDTTIEIKIDTIKYYTR